MNTRATPEDAAADPAGYAESLVRVRQALNRFERVAGMVGSGQKALGEAKAEANDAVYHSRVLLAWCERQAFTPVPGVGNG